MSHWFNVFPSSWKSKLLSVKINLKAFQSVQVISPLDLKVSKQFLHLPRSDKKASFPRTLEGAGVLVHSKEFRRGFLTVQLSLKLTRMCCTR